MANEEHLKLIEQGVDAWNKWREKHADTRWPDLSEVDLSWASLRGANLSEANLGGADLSWANLSWADLRRANLSGATLIGADLRRANLLGATLIGANLIGAILLGANLGEANLSGADLSGADLEEAVLVETNLENANLNGCRIYGISAWNIKVNPETKQSDLIVTKVGEPTVSVDNLEIGQFICLLLHNEKIRGIIDTITSKVVLILGRFTKERKRVLDAIREELRKHDYIPVLFDFDKPTTRDLHETITTLARMSRFVVADITDAKSIPQELVSIVEQLPSLPVQPILQQDGEPWAMYDHIKRYPWVLKLYPYATVDELIPRLGEGVISPAEMKVMEIRKKD